jgi:hypothetical protein
MVLSWPLAFDDAVLGGLGLEMVDGFDEADARLFGDTFTACFAKSGCELIPVPTAVPPSGSSRSASIARAARSTRRRTWRA